MSLKLNLFEEIKKLPIKRKKPAIKDSTPIQPRTLEEYAMEADDEIFVDRLKKSKKLADARVSELPPVVDAFQYVSQMVDKPPWFIEAQKILLENYKNAPELVSLTREYLQPSLIEYKPSSLDHVEPCASPPNMCESEIQGGFRCRALLFPNQIAVKDRIGYCYMCHLYKTNQLYVLARDRANELEEKDLFCIHSFIVHVNVPGEYKLDKMLPGLVTGKEGLYGPFPAYNRNNYRVINRSVDGLQQWVESDELVFRLPQVASPQM